MSLQKRIPIVPASFFSMVLGLAGLGGSWRAGQNVWQFSPMIGELLMLLATIVWSLLLLLYLLKSVVAPQAVLDEAAHPVQCCFIGLIGVATMLIAGAIAPYSKSLSLSIFLSGGGFTLLFAIWRAGDLWRGNRELATTTPVLYLPTVAGSFVAGTVAARLGFQDWGQFMFGMGLFSWLAIESVLLNRMLNSPSMTSKLRPTLGIQLAPPAVGAVTLINVIPEVPVIFIHMMIGYGVLQCLLMLRLLPWILEEEFSASYWSFTFGATAIATASIQLLSQGDHGAVTLLAPFLFLFANVVVGAAAIGTVWRLIQGRLLAMPPRTNAA